MATFVVAATAALVKPIIGKLSDKLGNDLGMFWGLEKECEKMKNMLITISMVLNDAEKKSITDDLVRHWLLQLQDIAYDIDDLLDEFQIDVQRKSKNNSSVRAVRDFFSSNNQVKYRTHMVAKLKKITKRLRKVVEEKKAFQLVEGNDLIEEDDTERETFSAINEFEVYGRKEEKDILINLLIHCESDKISTLAIIGMGGVGKTTLAQIICNDLQIKRHFDPIVWVHVPMNFKLSKILHRVIECISGKNCDVSNMEAMQNKVRTMISSSKFLLVLDDVWNEDATKWEKLKTILNHGMVGSKVLVTTRSESVARNMGTFDYIRVNPLEFEYCWELFEERAFRYINEYENVNLVNIGKEIVRKCNGLPLAAKHLGNLLGSRKVDWYAIRDNDIWQMEEYRCGIVPSLLLSYSYLPSHLKLCFAYCSLFPKGFLFKKEYLIQLWTIEGFISKSKHPQHLENVGSSCFDYLFLRSFFEKSEITFGDSGIYIMHDLIHDLACYVAGDKFFLRSESENKQNTVSWRYSSVCLNGGIEIKKLRTLISSHISFGTKLDSIMQLQLLRVLDLSHNMIKDLPSSIGNLSRLRYLNLSWNYFKILPDSITVLLNLEVLNLSRCHQLKIIPTDLGALHNLEVLNMDGCIALKNLPMSLCSLTNLKVLDLTRCQSLVAIPKGIGKLTNLERLPFLIVGGEEGCTIGELAQLNLLYHDLKIVVQEKWGLQDVCDANLGEKKYLKSLRLQATTRAFDVHETTRVSNVESIIQIGSLELPQQLEDFCIKGDGFRLNFTFDLPISLRTIDFPIIYTNLVNAILHGINECECFPQFGQLPRLKLLHLSLQFSIIKIKEHFSGSFGMYPVLEELKLSTKCFVEAPEVEEATTETEATRMMFPCLKKLVLVYCPFMVVFPFLPRNIEILDIVDDCGQHILSIGSLQGLYRLKKLALISVYIGFDVFEGMSYLTALEELEICYGDWFYLPPGLLNQHLPSLKSLKINGMEDLRELKKESLVIEEDESSRYQPPPLFDALEILVIENCKSLWILPDWLGTLFIQSLRIHKCPEVIEFPESMAFMSFLHTLHLSYLPKIYWLPESFENLTELQSLELSYLPNLYRLPRGTEELTSLQNLTIIDCFMLSRRYKMEIDKNGDEVYYKRDQYGDWYEISHIQYVNIYPIIEYNDQGGSEIEESENRGFTKTFKCCTKFI